MKLKLTLRTQAPQRGLVPDGITYNAVLSACDKGTNSTGGAWGMAGGSPMHQLGASYFFKVGTILREIRILQGLFLI